MWKATQALYPGTRLVHNTTPAVETSAVATTRLRETFFRVASVDGGTEWLGEWKEEVEKRGGTIRVSLPGESRTNADAERFNLETEVQTATCLATAGAPLIFWSPAARVLYHNMARTLLNDLGETPHLTLHGYEDTKELFPFGCRMAYVLPDDERDKFETRSGEGVLRVRVRQDRDLHGRARRGPLLGVRTRLAGQSGDMPAVHQSHAAWTGKARAGVPPRTVHRTLPAGHAGPFGGHAAGAPRRRQLFFGGGGSSSTSRS